jgi:hypothetical protein
MVSRLRHFFCLTLLLPGVAGTSIAARAAEPAPAMALLGTASHPGGAVAFFDGNRAEYQGAIHVGEKLGEWTLAAIEHDRVRLKSASSEVELPLQKQLRRDAAGRWETAELSGSFRPPEPPRAPITTTAPPAPVVATIPANPTAPGDENSGDKDLRKLDKKLLDALKPRKDDRKPDFKDDKERKPEKEMKRIEKEMRRDS